MLKRLKQYFIQKDNDYIFYKRFHDIIDELFYFDYEQMKFTGSNTDVLDFSKSSMFWWNDPIEIITNTREKNCKLLSDEERVLLVNTGNLIKRVDKGVCPLEISKFSGLSNANASDYGTLENYGNSLIPRSEWNKNQIYYYGFENDEDYKYLKGELLNSSSVNAAIYHTWTKRLYFHNGNKSHRLAALYRQDTRQRKNTTIELKLSEDSLNINSGKLLFENFIGIITTGKTYSFLVDRLKFINVQILLEELFPEKDRLYILWIRKTQKEILSDIVKFINLLSTDRCYIITNALKKYI